MKFPIEQILNLPEMKVLDFQEVEGAGIIITIEKSVNYCTCPGCGQTTHSIHQNHWRMIHDLSWSEKPVLLKINRRQFKCNKCKKVFSEKLSFVDKSKGYTKRLAIDIPLLSLSGRVIARSIIRQSIQAILLEKNGCCICY